MFLKYIADSRNTKTDVRLINTDKIIDLYLHEYNHTDSSRGLFAETDADVVYHLGDFPNAYIAKREFNNICKAIESGANFYTISYN